MSHSDYEVGYKRPPKHTQFKPGQSGNPKGRPKQIKSFADFLYDELFRMLALRENGERRRKMAAAEVIARGLVQGTARGDAKMRRDLLDLLKRYPRVAKRQAPLRLITPDMSPQEAAKVYAETLRSIPGLTEADHELDF